jgi:hypothetical protein
MSGNQSYLEAPARISASTITYWRGTKTWTNCNGQSYLHGLMVIPGMHVKELIYDTLERTGDGYVWLKPGFYPAAMETSADERNPGRRQIRPVHHQRNNKGNICNFLIHHSSPPHNLEGCIAPGYINARGLEASRQSLETIFLSLGGFEVGKKVFLRIEGEMPA